MPSEINFEMRERAYRLCRDYLHGAWKMVSPHDMVLKQVSGGLSNLLYYCALPPSHPPKSHEPSEVLLRIYGQVHGEDALESVLAESVIFALLSERRLGPRLYGVFPGGRLEEFIPARSMLTKELGHSDLSAHIASKMARIHALNVPISKEPTWMWNTMNKWEKSGREYLNKKPEVEQSIYERLSTVDFIQEIDYLKEITSKIQSPVIFSHNDMQEGNLLLNSQAKIPDDRVSLIDFEYCSYNYRGFDIANHFCEWMYEYKLPVHPYYTVDHGNFPQKDKQLLFIRSYMEAYENAKRRKTLPETTSDSSEDQINMANNNISVPQNHHPLEEKILAEVQVFTLASHLFWCLWSIVQGQISTIPFGYMEYAVTRLDHYQDGKEKLKIDTLTKRKSDELTPDT